MMRMRLGRTGAAASVRTVGVVAPGDVAAGTALGVGGYARRVVVMLRRRGWVAGALRGGSTALVVGALCLLVRSRGRGRSRGRSRVGCG